MLRLRAVASVVAEVAGLGNPRLDESEPVEDLRERLEQAARRAAGITVIAAGALGALILTRPKYQPFLSFGDGDTPFSLAALAVAFFAGFRFAQFLRYRAGIRSLESLPPES